MLVLLLLIRVRLSQTQSSSSLRVRAGMVAVVRQSFMTAGLMMSTWTLDIDIDMDIVDIEHSGFT